MHLLAGLTMEMFLIVTLGFFLLESIILYWRGFFLNYVVLGVFGFITWKYFHTNEIEYTYLLLYPLLGVIWMGCYWYLTMLRTASEITRGITQKGSIDKFHDSLSYGDRLRSHFASGTYLPRSVDIKHPDANELIANGLLFLPSMIVFFCDNFFRMAYNSMMNLMESVRKSFSDKINGKFYVPVDKSEKLK